MVGEGPMAYLLALFFDGTLVTPSDCSLGVPRSKVPNNSISWGLLFKPYGRLKLTLLAICIDIATL